MLTESYCPGCGRVNGRCICEIEFVHGAAYGEHRGSRAPEGHVPLDPDFLRAAGSGFAPLSEGEKEAFRERLEGMGTVLYGKRP